MPDERDWQKEIMQRDQRGCVFLLGVLGFVAIIVAIGLAMSAIG